jgi:Family of unknown function (DUF6232)
MYQLKGIINHDFLIIHPHRIMPLLIMVLGALTVVSGILRWVPKNLVPSFHILSLAFGGNAVIMISGIALLIAGAAILSLTKVRYAIRLATAEGEKNVVVSKRKEYITQILDALNKAYMNLVTPEREIGKTRENRTFVVGAR